jgi:hypothetical protein
MMTNLSEVPTEEYSCYSSVAAGEPLAGSGTQASHWLLLEYDTPWRGRALKESDLPAPIKQRLLAFEAEVEGGRVQFIRDQTGVRQEPRLILARADQPDRPLQQLNLTGYQDLLDLDLASLFNQPVPADQRIDPILIVCINGMRDLCCAREGTAAFQALAALEPERVFQTTHIGGHRFAANAIWLPYGINYGRLQSKGASELLAMMSQDQISLPNFRGRTTTPKPAQAAEFFLRQQGNWLGVHDLALRSIEGQQPHWQVTFDIHTTGDTATVEVQLEPEVYQVYKTTGDSDQAVTGEFKCELVGKRTASG